MEHFVTERERREEEKKKSGRKNKRRDQCGCDATYLAECLCRSRADFSDNTAGGTGGTGGTGRFVFLPRPVSGLQFKEEELISSWSGREAQTNTQDS